VTLNVNKTGLGSVCTAVDVQSLWQCELYALPEAANGNRCLGTSDGVEQKLSSTCIRVTKVAGKPRAEVLCRNNLRTPVCLLEYCCKFSHPLHLPWAALVPGFGKLFPCEVEPQESRLVARLPS